MNLPCDVPVIAVKLLIGVRHLQLQRTFESLDSPAVGLICLHILKPTRRVKQEDVMIQAV